MTPLTEHELHRMWATARLHIIVSGIGPILLLAATIALVMAGLGAQPAPIKLAAALVLLSTGILGALVQLSAASEGVAIAADLKALGSGSALTARIIAESVRATIITRVTPTIFVLTYLALLWAIFAPQSVGGMQPAL